MHILNEATFRISDFSKQLIRQNLELLTLSVKDLEDLVPKIQKPISKNFLNKYFNYKLEFKKNYYINRQWTI
jgi:hypothetical protein